MVPHVRRLEVVTRLDDAVGLVVGTAREGDVVITLGAGSIAGLADRVVAALARREVRT